MNCYWKDNCKLYKKNQCQGEDCIKFYKMSKLYKNALMTDKQKEHIQLHLDADGADRDIFVYLKNIEEHIEQFINEGQNLYLHSNQCGNSKTSWAIRLLQSYINNVWYKVNMDECALFINVPRFLIELKSNISQRSEYAEGVLKCVNTAKVVVWDEVGTKSLSAYEHENLLTYINARLDKGLSNIYTSNLTPSELKDAVGDRLYSRIVNNSIDLCFKGADKRGIK